MDVSTTQLQDLAARVDGEVSWNYSGRSMFGRTCVGIVHDINDIAFGVQLAQVFEDEAEELANDARTDSMGRSSITYFPSIPGVPERPVS